MVDYANLAATAQRLIEKNGRTLTVTKLTEVDADLAKPWGAPDSVNTSVAVIGVVIPVTLKDDDVTLVRRGAAVAYVAALSGGANELETFDELLDGTDVWKISDVELINPGDTRIMYTMSLRR